MTPDAVTRWLDAGTTRSVDSAISALSPEVLFVSPLTERFAFHGHDEVRALLEAVFTVVTDHRAHVDAVGDDTTYVRVEARVREVRLEEFQRLETDASGLITSVTVAMRPLPAITAFARAIGPVLARRENRPGVARVLSAAGAFLDQVASAGDTRFIALAAPARVRSASSR